MWDSKQGDIDMVDGGRRRVAVNNKSWSRVAVEELTDIHMPHGGSAWIAPWLHRGRTGRPKTGAGGAGCAPGVVVAKGDGGCMPRLGGLRIYERHP